MSWFKKVFGGGESSSDQPTNPAPSNAQGQPQPAPAESNMVRLDDPRYQQFASARDGYWNGIGTLDPDVIAYMISPQFSGKPAWPTTRQAFRVVRGPSGVIIASDGLSDLFVDTSMQDAGFECEVYIETPQLAGADFQQVSGSWAFELIENFAANVAHAGGINRQLEDYGVLSMELPAPESMPREWVNANDYVGALINLPVAGRAPTLDLGSGAVIRMIPLTLITPAETQYVVDNGAQGRATLAEKLTAAGVGAASDLTRASLV
jgi:hypothetical protein